MSRPSIEPTPRRDNEDRWEWLEHLVPLQFVRVLWNGLFPSRFRRLVLDGIDGTPTAGYARPFTFCLACWLLFFSVQHALPLYEGIFPTLSALPTAERRQLAHALGIDTMATVVIPDTGVVRRQNRRWEITGRVRALTHKRFREPTSSEIASYLESHGNRELGLRVRGYASRAAEHPPLFDEVTIVLFAVFGLVPAWWVSHRILASRTRSFRETRYVHMYNDSWLLVFTVVGTLLAVQGSVVFNSKISGRVLLGLAAAALIVWLVRTPRLFRETHGASFIRVFFAHVLGLLTAFAMLIFFTLFRFGRLQFGDVFGL